MESTSRPQQDNGGELFKDNVIFNIIFLSLIAIFTNFGNFLILAAFKKHNFVRNMDILIAFLALMDFSGPWVVLPIAIYTYAAPEVIAENEIVERILCKISGASFLFIQLTSTVAITLMTSDRFAAVKKPFFYRNYCEKRPKYIKIILVILSILLLGLSISVVFLGKESFRFRDGICTFDNSWGWGKLVILFVGLSQIPIVIFCYTAFVLTVRKLDRKRSSYLKRLHQPKSSNNAGCQLLLTQNRSGNRRVNSTSCQRAPLKCSPPPAKAIPPSKDVYVNRGSRLSGTVALVVGIYYVPWIFMLLSTMIEMCTKENHDVFHYVAIRFVFMDSIFNPFIYARMTRYATAFGEIICCPFRFCGCYTKPYPDGMTASEVHRIVHRLAVEEWESPGLNRRMYGKTNMTKSHSGDCYEESFSELTGNSRLTTSTPRFSQADDKIADSSVSVEEHGETGIRQERRQSDSRKVDHTATGPTLHQKSLSDSYISLCFCKEDENKSLQNDQTFPLDSATAKTDFKSMKSSNSEKIEISNKKIQETDNLPVDRFLVKSRRNSSFSNRDENDTNPNNSQRSRSAEKDNTNDNNEICEFSSSTEVSSNASTVPFDELSLSSAENQQLATTKPDSAETYSREGRHISNVILGSQRSQITQPHKGVTDENQMKTKKSKEKDDLTVLLRTRVEKMKDSRKIKFQLEILDPSGLIKWQRRQIGEKATIPTSSNYHAPNFVFSLKENRFVLDESSKVCQKIKTFKIAYTLKKPSGDDHDRNKDAVKLSEPVLRNEAEEDPGVSGLQRSVPLNDMEYITPL